MSDKEIAAIARMVMLAADSAVMDGMRDGTIHTSADRTRIAVDAALECAIDNGLLLIAPDLQERLAAGVTIKFKATP